MEYSLISCACNYKWPRTSRSRTQHPRPSVPTIDGPWKFVSRFIDGERNKPHFSLVNKIVKPRSDRGEFALCLSANDTWYFKKFTIRFRLIL